MKNKVIKFILFTLCIASFLQCEKDDICDPATTTTPTLVIEFYDNNATSSLKNVDNLVVNNNDVIEVIKFSAVSKIKIPLKTNMDKTQYNFRLVSASDIPVLLNEDKIEINYTRKDVYISRACGFKTSFQINTNAGLIISPDSNNWIKNVTIVQPSITNENEIHIKLFI